MYPITNFDVGIDVNHELMHRDGLSRVLIARYHSLRNSPRGTHSTTSFLLVNSRSPRAETRYKEAFSLPWPGRGGDGEKIERKERRLFSSIVFFASIRIFTR